MSSSQDSTPSESTALVRDERGATAVEYGLMVSMLALVIVAAVLAFGNEVNDLFTRIPDQVWG